MKKTAPFIIIAVVTAIVYSGVFSGGFLRDDFPVITENPWITSPSHIPEIFSSTLWAFYQGDFITGSSNYYRPVMHLLLMGSYSLFGLEPAGYHGVNLAFHILNAILVFLIASAVMRKEPETGGVRFSVLPLAAALFFALHPASAEPVVWVAAIGELSFTFFFMLAFYLFILNGQGKGAVFYIGALLIYSVALFSKETATIIAPLFILYGIAEGRGVASSVKRGSPFLVAAVLFVLIRSSIVGPLSAEHAMGGFQYVLSMVTLAAQYTEKLFFPFGIKLYYPFHAPASVADIMTHELGVFMVALVLAVVWLVKASSRKTVAFFLLWISFALAPPVLMVKYIQGEWVFASRYLYFSIAGLSILAAFWLGRLSRGGQLKLLYAAPVLIVFVLFAAESWRAGSFWTDEFSFWEKAAMDAPMSPTTHASLGVAYAEKKMYQEAIHEYELALKIAPESIGIYSNLGVAYYNLKEMDRAIEMFSRARTYAKDEARASGLDMKIGLMYLEKGTPQMAIAHFERAASSAAADANPFSFLGIAYARTGQMDKAYAAFSEAVRLDPQNPTARQGIEKLAEMKGAGRAR